MTDQKETKSIAVVENKELSDNLPAKKKVIQFGELDVSNLSEEQLSTLEEEHAREVIRIRAKAAETEVDNVSLAKKLLTISDSSKKESENNTSFELTNEFEDTIGKTKMRVSDKESHTSKTNSIHNYIWAGVALALILGAVIVGVSIV